MDSGFQGQFLNPTVLNKSPLPSNNAKFSSTHGYELPFFQNRSHENDAKFHLPWNKPCDSIILPGTFLCLHSTWTRKISMPGIYGGWTNYWMDSAEEVPLTPLSSALCSGFPSSKVVSLQCLGNAGTQKATSNLPSLCWERERISLSSFPKLPPWHLWYVTRLIRLQSPCLFKTSPSALHSQTVLLL